MNEDSVRGYNRYITDELIKSLSIIAQISYDRKVSIKMIIPEVSRLSGVDERKLLSKDRSQGVIFYKQASQFLLREKGINLQSIAIMYESTHAAVLFNVSRMRSYLDIAGLGTRIVNEKSRIIIPLLHPPHQSLHPLVSLLPLS